MPEPPKTPLMLTPNKPGKQQPGGTPRVYRPQATAQPKPMAPPVDRPSAPVLPPPPPVTPPNVPRSSLALKPAAVSVTHNSNAAMAGALQVPLLARTSQTVYPQKPAAISTVRPVVQSKAIQRMELVNNASKSFQFNPCLQ